MSHLHKSHSPTIQDLRQRVLTCLDRLSDRATLTQAIAELELISRTLAPDSLAPFISCLCSIDSSYKSSVRTHSVKLLICLATFHKDSLLPLLPKILSSFLLRRLKDSDSAVRSACVDAASSLARHVTTTSSSFRILFDPLFSAMSIEQDNNVQIGSGTCLAAAIDAAPEVESGELRKVLPRMVKLVKSDGFRAKAALLGVIGSALLVNEGAVVNNKVLMGCVVNCVVGFLSSDDWMARKAAAEVLEKVADAAERELVVEFKRLCVNTLESRRFDKVKVARETMNRALEAWKEVSSNSIEDSPFLSRSNSSVSKDTSSGGYSPPISYKSSPGRGFQTPQQKKTISKTRSSLSDDSCITVASSSLSKSSPDASSESPQINKKMHKSKSSLSYDFSVGVTKKKSPSRNIEEKLSTPVTRSLDRRKSIDWKVEIALPRAPSFNMSSEDDVQCRSSEGPDAEPSLNAGFKAECTSKKMIEERGRAFGGFRTRSRIVPFGSDEDSEKTIVVGKVREEINDNGVEFENFSLIREQLVQIEKQQSFLLDMLQRFMGKSQSGIDSLETRVTGLEKALDEISYDLAVQSGRIPNKDPEGNTCCMPPGAEFWSPKFWKRTEGRLSAPRSGGSINGHQYVGAEALDVDGHKFQPFEEGINKQSSDVCIDSWRSAESSSNKASKNVSQNNIRIRTCSRGNFDGVSSPTCITPVVQRS